MSIEAMKQALESCAAFLLSAGFESSDVYAEICNAIEQAEKQEPVAYMDDKGYICNFTTNPERYTPLYTAPPQREWQGLTDEEIRRIACGDVECWSLSEAALFKSIARAIEAKLKEKNHVS